MYVMAEKNPQHEKLNAAELVWSKYVKASIVHRGHAGVPVDGDTPIGSPITKINLESTARLAVNFFRPGERNKRSGKATSENSDNDSPALH